MRIIKKRKSKPFDDPAAHLAAARIIVAEPLKYPGVMQDWAKLILQKAELPSNIRDHAPAKAPYS